MLKILAVIMIANMCLVQQRGKLFNGYLAFAVKLGISKVGTTRQKNILVALKKKFLLNIEAIFNDCLEQNRFLLESWGKLMSKYID